MHIEQETEKWLKAYMVERALTKKELLEASFYRLPYEPYKPVR